MTATVESDLQAAPTACQRGSAGDSLGDVVADLDGGAGGPAPWRSTRSSATACSTAAASAVQPEVLESIATDNTVAVGSASPCPAMSGALPWTGSNMHGRVPLGVDVAAGRQPDATGDGGAKVGEDVTEQVVGHDDVEALGLGHEEDRRGVDVAVVDGDVGELWPSRCRRCGSTGRRRRPARCSCAPGSACARGRASARRTRTRTTRSTPNAVFRLSSVAISCGVPLRITPPAPAYGPSVPSRTTTSRSSRAGRRPAARRHPGRAGPGAG